VNSATDINCVASILPFDGARLKLAWFQFTITQYRSLGSASPSHQFRVQANGCIK